MNDELKKFVQGELERITVKVSTSSKSTGFKGTGFFISKNGYILTAWHCIQEAEVLDSDIFVECEDGEKFLAKLKTEKSVKDLDIAVIKIPYQMDNCIPLGLVPKNPKGDDVIGVGYPGIHRNNAGMGIYSGNITRFVNHDLEIEGAIKGQGQSGGLIYHSATHRIIGVVKKVYGGNGKEMLLQDAGLAAKVDAVFSKWEELSDISEEIAKAWDERLEGQTQKTNNGKLKAPHGQTVTKQTINNKGAKIGTQNNFAGEISNLNMTFGSNKN